jgi:hypothetical protein
MNELNGQLQKNFYFSFTDLRANRGGQLSARQQARMRAAGSNTRLAIAIFIVVLLGSVGFIAVTTLGSGLPVSRLTLVITAVVVGVVILIGVLSSLKYITAQRARKISVAKGIAQAGRVREDQANFPIKIGATSLRLLALEQLEAFQQGVEYRVFYLAGPVPTILSAEVVGSEAELDALEASEPEAPVDQDSVVQLQRRGRAILYVLAVLALGIPLAGFAIPVLPPVLRWVAWAGLCGVSVVFIFWAVWRIRTP